MRLAGHTLIGGGAPHLSNGVRIMRMYGGTFGGGHGKCSCGALSGDLPSSTKRKAWHRTHKEQVGKANGSSDV
jgi:hypothetical protein